MEASIHGQVLKYHSDKLFAIRVAYTKSNIPIPEMKIKLIEHYTMKIKLNRTLHKKK